MTIESLRTQEEVKKARRQLFEKQKGVDPILKKKIDYADSVLDHDHVSQHCRAALHRQTNAFEGLVVNAYKRCLQWLTDVQLSDILRNLADYLEQDYRKNDFHPGWMKRVKADFNKLTAKQQNTVLVLLGLTEGANPQARKTLFLRAIKLNDYPAVSSAIKSVI